MVIISWCVCQITALHTSILHRAVCQLCLKRGRKNGESKCFSLIFFASYLPKSTVSRFFSLLFCLLAFFLQPHCGPWKFQFQVLNQSYSWGLCHSHSHSHMGSKLHLWPTLQPGVTPDPQVAERPGIELTSSQRQCWVLNKLSRSRTSLPFCF